MHAENTLKRQEKKLTSDIPGDVSLCHTAQVVTSDLRKAPEEISIRAMLNNNNLAHILMQGPFHCLE